MVLQDDISTLIAAIINNNFDKVKKIIENKPAIVNFVIPSNKNLFGGDTPLHIALGYGGMQNKSKDNKIAELLIDKGADVNAKNKFGNTPLHEASANGYNDIVELLLEKGADANAENCFQETPLSKAVNKKNPSAVQLLLNAGANPNPQLQDKAIMQLLREAGVDVADYDLLSQAKDPEIRARPKRSRQCSLQPIVGGSMH